MIVGEYVNVMLGDLSHSVNGPRRKLDAILVNNRSLIRDLHREDLQILLS